MSKKDAFSKFIEELKPCTKLKVYHKGMHKSLKALMKMETLIKFKPRANSKHKLNVKGGCGEECDKPDSQN